MVPISSRNVYLYNLVPFHRTDTSNKSSSQRQAFRIPNSMTSKQDGMMQAVFCYLLHNLQPPVIVVLVATFCNTSNSLLISIDEDICKHLFSPTHPHDNNLPSFPIRLRYLDTISRIGRIRKKNITITDT